MRHKQGKALKFKELRCIKKILELVKSSLSKSYNTPSHDPVVRYKISTNISGYLCVYGSDPLQDKVIKL